MASQQKQKEYLKLLIRRENREVLGKNWINLWLLAIVLTATFVSIAFSNGSLKYLAMKMDDPFTNWVSISKSYDSSDFNGLRRALNDQEIQEHYLFGDVQSDNYMAYSFIGRNGAVHYLQGRFFNNIDSKLVRAILDKSNIVANSGIPFEKLQDRAFGFVITGEVLKKLGYNESNIPAYIDYLRLSEGADTLGVEMFDGERAAVPMPLLGVVKRLPGNMDMISSRFFLEQDMDDHSYPLDMNNRDYQSTLLFFVPEEISDEEFRGIVQKAVPDSLNTRFDIMEDEKPELQSWKKGRTISVFFNDFDLPIDVFQSTARKIKETAGEKDIKRLFNYRTVDNELSTSQFISINFNSLDSIRAFENFANDNYRVKIEMSQVNAKENFNDVSVMANILSWSMIAFSLVCIILFVINMLQSYFQKVKRNLGTFKAFGISTKELIRTYVFIVLVIVVGAVGVALLAAWLLQIFLSLAHIEKEEGFSYLSLNSLKTLWAVIIVIGSAILTVFIVMKNLLQRTPGDLIYDRE
ncbi:MAG: hypothetical protein J1F43_01850 [Muribaculaceae bacterium]|nr:hypothetical protein [Muribaculaceae bacterium]